MSSASSGAPVARTACASPPVSADVPPSAGPFLGARGGAPAGRGGGGGALAPPPWARFVLEGGERAGPAPALQPRRELPGQIDCLAHAAVHAEPAGRDDEVNRVARE